MQNKRRNIIIIICSILVVLMVIGAVNTEKKENSSILNYEGTGNEEKVFIIGEFEEEKEIKMKKEGNNWHAEISNLDPGNYSYYFQVDGEPIEYNGALEQSLIIKEDMELMASSYGAFTLLPPIIAIVLAFLTKNVIISLFIGILSGAFLINLIDKNIIMSVIASFQTFTEIIIDSLADPWNAGIILQVFAIGGLIALIGKMGGAKAVAISLGRKAKTARSAQLTTWFLGLFVFFDDYANSLIVGPIMRPVTDKMKISREKLAFIVDATAAPIAGIVIISTWVGYEMSLIKDAYMNPVVNMDVNAFSIFVETIPYRFYNILMLVFVVVSAVTLKEFGAMYKAEKRARKTGKVVAEGSEPMVSSEATELEPDDNIKLRVRNAVVPILTLIIGSLVGFYLNGLANTDTVISGPWYEKLGIIFGNSDASIVIFQAALLAGIVALIMGSVQSIYTIKEGIDVWIKGMKSLLITGVILLLAWSLSGIIKELGTSYYLVQAVEKLPEYMNVLLPSIIFILGSIISFATGTSYGTMGILMPLAVPIGFAASGGNPEFMLACVSAVLSGAILGDHCSPISDTTILSSMGAACDHVDHTRTQLPYAFTVGIIAVVFGYIPIGLGINIWVVLPISIIATIATLLILGKKVEE